MFHHISSSNGFIYFEIYNDFIMYDVLLSIYSCVSQKVCFMSSTETRPVARELEFVAHISNEFSIKIQQIIISLMSLPFGFTSIGRTIPKIWPVECLTLIKHIVQNAYNRIPANLIL